MHFNGCVLISLALLFAALSVELNGAESNGVSVVSHAAESSDATRQAHPELENLFQVSAQIYSGGQPQGAAAFATLARLGIKTVVSVDGGKPDVATARIHGLRYVHVPIGYDGIPTDAGLSLARLVRDVKGPFYIHCHHGYHRGPSAAAVAWIASGNGDGNRAVEILKQAGTGENYLGLWRDVQNYQPPSPETELPQLEEVAKVPSLAEIMSRVGRAYDNLKQCQDASWSAPINRHDFVPAEQALLLKESLRELARDLDQTTGKRFDQDFITRLKAAESIARNLETSLTMHQAKAASSRHFELLKQSCVQCHDHYRN